MDLIKQIELDNIKKRVETLKIPSFAAGDTLKVSLKIVEGTRERVQVYEGVCIARSNSAFNSSFTVRKISYGEGVERVFPLYSPLITNVEIVRHGDVRRAKLYYLRDRRGKSARIKEKIVRKVSPSVVTSGPDAASLTE